jgi:hypothetical protein
MAKTPSLKASVRLVLKADFLSSFHVASAKRSRSAIVNVPD